MDVLINAKCFSYCAMETQGTWIEVSEKFFQTITTFFFVLENVFVQFRKCQWSILMMFLSVDVSIYIIYMYIHSLHSYTVNMTDKRKVCNRSFRIVFRIKLLTDTIKYTLQTVENNCKWNSKWLAISFVIMSWYRMDSIWRFKPGHRDNK